MKPLNPLEKHEQMAFCAYLALKKIPYFAIPNGGSRNALEALSLSKQGVSPGVPDLMIPVVSGEYHGLFIEMKRKGGTVKDVTKHQKEWHKTLLGNGYCVVVCFGVQEAMEAVQDYIRGFNGKMPDQPQNHFVFNTISGYDC